MLEDMRDGCWFLAGLLIVVALLLGVFGACRIASASPDYEWAELRLPCGDTVSGEIQELTISGNYAAVVIDGVAYLVSRDNVIFVNRP